MVEDAVALLIDVRDWDNLAKLILDRATDMTAQGRNKTLAEWLLSLPREMMENTPWLLYWFGACRLPFNPTESRRCFDAAFQQFHAQDDQTGMWLSWSFVVDTIFYAWEDISPLHKYAEIFQDIYRKEIPFPSLSVESRVVSCRFIIMVMSEMHHPEISAWAERVFTLVQQSHDAHFRLQIGYYLAVYYLWTGDFTKGQVVAGFLQKDSQSESASPLLSLFGRAIVSMYAYLSGSIGHSLRIVSDGLEFAQKTGVHIWDNQLIAHGGLPSLSAGDVGTLSDLIGKMELSLPTTKKIDVSYYYYLSSGMFFLKGDMPSATRYIELAVKAVTEIGSPFPIAVCNFWWAQILFELGKTALLNIARQIGLQLKSKNLEFQIS
ncbi:MAG: malT [Candidatus Brocadiaceae bacterium]|nr:malT [Candidatus Brocadiaceae bacterium]